MGKYTIKDLKIGDRVYHLSNTRILMVIININENGNKVVCRWMDSSGLTREMEFIAEELGKSSDLKPRFRSM